MPLTSMDTSDMDPELARYLDRNYWQQKSVEVKSTGGGGVGGATQPSAPAVFVESRMSSGPSGGYQQNLSKDDEVWFVVQYPFPLNTVPLPFNTLPLPFNTLGLPFNTLTLPFKTLPLLFNTLTLLLNTLHAFRDVARIFGLGGLILAEVWVKKFRGEQKKDKIYYWKSKKHEPKHKPFPSGNLIRMEKINQMVPWVLVLQYNDYLFHLFPTHHQKYQNGETTSLSGGSNDARDQYLGALRSSIEIFVNRMKSNSQRGRSIANDSSVQTLFMTLNAMHPQLVSYIHEQEEKRGTYGTPTYFSNHDMSVHILFTIASQLLTWCMYTYFSNHDMSVR